MVKLIEEDQVNGDKLRQAREAKGWDWVHVSRLCSLSVAQVKALENGGTDCFYSLPIKNNAARKVALVLGVADVLNATASQQADDAMDLISLAPVHHAEGASSGRSKPTRWTYWMGYSTLGLIFVTVVVGSGLHLKTSSSEVGRSEVVGSLQKSPNPSNSERVAVAESVGSDLLQNQMRTPNGPMVAQVPAKNTPFESEIVPASLGMPSDPACAFEGEVSVLEASNPTKSAEKVSLMLHKAGKLCVQDASGKVWQEELKPWMGRTFVGKAPWKLHSPALPNADVYFQGEKLKLTSASARTIALNGKEVQ